MRPCLLLCLLGCALGASAAARPAAAEPAPNPGTALITGSDRGIGLALAREFESRGWRVIATCRDPAKATELTNFAHDHTTVSVEKLDVSDDAAIDALVAKLKGRPIDALVNNAGTTGSVEAQTLSKLDPDAFLRVLRVNSYAPLRVSAAFLELVAASRQRKIIGMSSGYGSLASVEKIAADGYPNAYYYAMSKAALNMGLREFAFEVAPRHVTTVLLSPALSIRICSGTFGIRWQKSVSRLPRRCSRRPKAPTRWCSRLKGSSLSRMASSWRAMAP